MALASQGEAWRCRITSSLREVVLNELQKVTLLSYSLILPFDGLAQLPILTLQLLHANIHVKMLVLKQLVHQLLAAERKSSC